MNPGEFISLREEGNPTLVLLHGTGGDENDMIGLGARLSKTAGKLSIRGKEPENGVNRWFRRFGEGVFDEPNLRMRALELADFVVRTLPDKKRIAVGFSNGANIAAAVLLLEPDAFDAAILMAPMVPLQPSEMPDLEGKPILMICGERDHMVPRTNALTLATMYETAGAVVDLHWHPGGHMISATELNVAAAWIARNTSPGDV